MLRNVWLVFSLLLGVNSLVAAQVSIGIGLPGLSIGINLPTFPVMVQVPGHPVYYAPRLHSNFFFYDGMYWVYQSDNWYVSSWYNGPWSLVGPEYVPLFILRIPVRYYQAPPAYFHGWRQDAPPRWAEHWGADWESKRKGWQKWDRNAIPAPAPLPRYQRQYSGERYPHELEQQEALHGQHYRYRPRDTLVRQHYQQRQHGPRAPDASQQEPSGTSQQKGGR